MLSVWVNRGQTFGLANNSQKENIADNRSYERRKHTAHFSGFWNIAMQHCGRLPQYILKGSFCGYDNTMILSDGYSTKLLLGRQLVCQSHSQLVKYTCFWMAADPNHSSEASVFDELHIDF